MKMQFRKRVLGTIGAASMVLALAACQSNSDAAGDEDRNTATSLVRGGDEGECSTDQAGGAVTVTEQVEYASLDPVAPSNYPNPMAAIFSVLMRYDPAEQEYEPLLAESLERNEDASIWTLKLKEGTTFGDGSAMTAEDVIASIDRFRAKTSYSNYSSRARYIDTMKATDDRTVEFTLVKPWTDFDYLLASPVGMIVNPRVPADTLTSKPPAGAGAGAFVLDRWTPGNELVLSKKDEWWDGPVCLDSLRFITQNDANARRDTFENGEAQVFNSNANLEVSAKVVEDPEVNYVKWPLRLGLLPNFGVGPEKGDAPLANPDIRRGLQLTLDPEFMVERVNQGAAEPTTALVSTDNPINPGLKGISYDKAEGTSLLEKAKKEGWDGKLTIMSLNQPGNLVVANNAAALWKDVGVDVSVEPVEISELIAAIMGGGGYDLQVSGASVAPLAECVSCDLDAYRTGSSSNQVAFSDETIDALAQRADALSDDEVPAFLEEYQDAWNASIPRLVYGQQYYLQAWTNKLQGVKPSRFLLVDFSKAWLEQ